MTLDIQTARRAAMYLRWASELLTKYAILAEAGADANGVIPQAEDNLRMGANAAGFDVERRETYPDPPKDYADFGNLPVHADPGPDDGSYVEYR